MSDLEGRRHEVIYPQEVHENKWELLIKCDIVVLRYKETKLNMDYQD